MIRPHLGSVESPIIRGHVGVDQPRVVLARGVLRVIATPPSLSKMVQGCGVRQGSRNSIWLSLKVDQALDLSEWWVGYESKGGQDCTSFWGERRGRWCGSLR